MEHFDFTVTKDEVEKQNTQLSTAWLVRNIEQWREAREARNTQKPTPQVGLSDESTVLD